MSETLTKTPKRCCLMMDKALDEDYLSPTICFTFDAGGGLKVYPPHIEGKPLTPRSRKHKPGLILNYCPWCGKLLKVDGEQS